MVCGDTALLTWTGAEMGDRAVLWRKDGRELLWVLLIGVVRQYMLRGGLVAPMGRVGVITRGRCGRVKEVEAEEELKSSAITVAEREGRRSTGGAPPTG